MVCARFVRSTFLFSLGLGLSLAATPHRAEACGGTFCDSGPQAMPVDQTGETILFVMGPDYVEAHIRIEIDPDTEATNFAWLVPVPVVPEFSVSSEQMFLNILGATVPTYGRTTTSDDCPGGTSSGGGGAFISDPDGGFGTGECDVWKQDCGQGEKCMPWANDGGNAWNATKCSPVHPNPNQPGDACTVESSGVSGIDDCDKGSMCFGVNPDTLTGVCVSMCTGGADAPTCPNGGVCEISHDGVLALCQTACDPKANDCPEGQACLENGAGEHACTPVHFQGTVGAFDVVVIGGNSADEVMQWLGDNGYQQDPAAMPILAQYIEEGHLFAAFKLSNGAGTDTVHPIALRLPGASEACIPLRLTRIAAQDNMKVRALFLGDARTAPRKWRHVVPNPLRMNWSSLAANYDEAVTLAVDELPANGRAFTTEYAGPSDIVVTDGLWSAAWDPDAFVTIDPTAVVDQLQTQGLMACATDTCAYAHPLLQSLLGQFLPVPAGVAPDSFYGCLSCFADQIDPAAWDGPGFAAAMDDRIVAPGQRARDMLETWPYLTRLFTTISPFEMTIDPLFQENFNLPPVQNITPTATQRVLCNGDSVWTLPDGREVYLPSGNPWPTFTGAMPWSETIALVPPAGAPMVEANNTESIDALLREYNCGFNWPSPEACGNSDPDGGSSSGSGSSSGDSGPDGTSTSGTSGGNTGGDQNGDGFATRACACRSEGNRPGWWLVSIGLLVVARRRGR